MENDIGKCRIKSILKDYGEPHVGQSSDDLYIQAFTGTDFYKYLGILQATQELG